MIYYKASVAEDLQKAKPKEIEQLMEAIEKELVYSPRDSVIHWIVDGYHVWYATDDYGNMIVWRVKKLIK